MSLASWLQLFDRRYPLAPRGGKQRRRLKFTLEELEVDYAPAILVGPNLNVTKSSADDAETSIVVNPTNPLNLFASDTSSGANRYSLDGGATWTDSDTSSIFGGTNGGDQQEAWDQFGNLFMTYFAGGNDNTVVALSVDGGKTFSLL